VVHRNTARQAFRFVPAPAADACLHQCAAVILRGTLDAVAVPKNYCSWFGRSRLELVLATLAFVLALPVFLLLAGGAIAACRLLRPRERLVLSALRAGMLGCFLNWLAVSVRCIPTDLPVGAEHLPQPSMLESAVRVPSWAASSFLAPWLGFVLAARPFRRGKARDAWLNPLIARATHGRRAQGTPGGSATSARASAKRCRRMRGIAMNAFDGRTAIPRPHTRTPCTDSTA
jgi:hypothetical protein